MGLTGTATAASTVNVLVTENNVITGFPASLTTGDTNWYTEDTRMGGAISFVNDYSAPLGLGKGSLEMTTDQSTNAKAQLISHQFAGTPLADVTTLGNQTYHAPESVKPDADASFQLQVDLDGKPTTADRSTLVYEPYWNGNVTEDWQSWDLMTGKFWSSKSFGGLIAGAGGPPLYTLADVLTLDPNAVVLGIGANVGSNNPSYTVAVDGITFGTTSGTTLFDFEHLVLPTDRDECKAGGWETSFTQFRNQGDCVSYVASNGTSRSAR
jgi:hypothetical protein